MKRVSGATTLCRDEARVRVKLCSRFWSAISPSSQHSIYCAHIAFIQNVNIGYFPSRSSGAQFNVNPTTWMEYDVHRVTYDISIPPNSRTHTIETMGESLPEAKAAARAAVLVVGRAIREADRRPCSMQKTEAVPHTYKCTTRTHIYSRTSSINGCEANVVLFGIDEDQLFDIIAAFIQYSSNRRLDELGFLNWSESCGDKIRQTQAIFTVRSKFKKTNRKKSFLIEKITKSQQI